MGMIDEAIKMGHSVKDIISVLSQNNPEFGERVNQAMAAGYTAEQVLTLLSNQFKSKKTDGAARAMGINPRFAKNLAFSPDLDPATIIPNSTVSPDQGANLRRTLGTLGAGALGAVTGGATALGAMGGAAAGLTGGSDILKKYEEARSKNRSLSLGDFLGAMAKGAGGAALAGTAANLLRTLGGGLGAGTAAAPQPGSPPPGTAAPQPMAQATAEAEVSPQAAAQSMQPEPPPVASAIDALSILKSSKLANTLETTLNLPVADAAGVMKTIIGPKASKALEAKVGMPFEKLVEIGRTQLETPKESTRAPIAQLDEFVSKIPTLDVSDAPKRKLGAKQIAAIPSSNLRSIEYNPETKDLITLFSPSGPKSVGEIYLHPDVQPDEVEDILKGATTITRGENRIRAWALGKEGSFGAGFDRFKKKFHENRESVAIDPSYIPGSHLLDVRKADQIFMAAQSFEPFEELTLKAKARQSKQDFANQEEMFRALDDSTFEAIYAEVAKGMLREKQASKQAGKQVRYKGGASKEMLNRMKNRAQQRG